MIKGLAVSLGTLSLALSPLVMAQTTPAPTTPADTSTGPTSTSAQGTALPMGQANVIAGWSVKKQLMGKSVENEMDEKIGDIRDLIVDNTGKVTHYIIGAGGFLGVGEHDVAIPFDRISVAGNSLRLNGYTKDQLKALPKAQVD